MAFTKITASGIGSTETVTIDGLSVINDGSFGGSVSVAGTLTYEDVTNIDSVGLITARAGVVVGSGITLSKDGDIFATGITTVSGNVKVGTGITLSPDGDVFFTGIATGNGSGLTNIDTDLVNDTSPQLGGDLQSNGNDIDFADSDKAVFGSDSDMQMYHDGSGGAILNDTGQFTISSDNALNLTSRTGQEYFFRGYTNGAAELYHDNSKKLETTSSGVTVTGAVTDSKGNLRSIPLNNQASAYTLVAADAGKTISSNGGTITVDASVMSSGDAVTLINNSGSNQTITQGSGLTIYNTADAATGNRTLAARGMATIYFFSATVAYISGAGLS